MMNYPTNRNSDSNEARKPTASITPTNPRYALWCEIMGGPESARSVPIVSPVPHVATALGHGDGAEFYHLDLPRISAEQRERLVSVMAREFGLSKREVESDLDDPKHGVPILAEGVSVLFDARMLL